MSRVNDVLGSTSRYYFDGVSTLDAPGDFVANRFAGERAAFADVSRASELVEFDGADGRDRYYVHGVSYIDERLMMYP